jgi:two-component system response regulator NreC
MHYRGRIKEKDNSPMPKIKCLLVDDHTLFRQGVRRLLETENDFEVVGEAADGGEAVEKARELRPDIVLMDIGMPGLSSFESARQIKKNRMETKILFLTMYEDEDYLVQCLEVGASGYVLKDTPAPQLLTAVKDVYKGGKYLSSQVLGKLVEDFRSRVRDTRMRPRISTLTPREREILKLLAEGNSVKEIAVILGLSVKTVEAHKFNLMRKLDIHNKAQLVTYAIQKKIIKIPVNQ